MEFGQSTRRSPIFIETCMYILIYIQVCIPYSSHGVLIVIFVVSLQSQIFPSTYFYTHVIGASPASNHHNFFKPRK